MSSAVCIGCGCDDFHSCPGGCWWLRVDDDEGLGVCSECDDRVEAWDRGDHTSHAVPIEQIENPPPPTLEACTAEERAPKQRPDGRCDHNWLHADGRDGDYCTRCGMSHIRYVFTECP